MHKVLILLALFGPAATLAAEPVDRIIAVVNEGVVLHSELAHAVDSAQHQLQERQIALPPEHILRTQVLERLILTKLQTQRAAEAGIRVDDRELNEVLLGLARQNNMDLSQFADAVRRQGLDYLSVREQVRDEILVNRLRSREIESRIHVTDQDVDLFLANQKQLDQAEYRLSHILIAVPDGAASAVRKEAQAQAEDLLAQVRDGGDFAQLAIAHSDGQQALQGGDLDWRGGGNLPEIFAREAQNLSPGQVGGVLENTAGFHLIRLEGVRGGEERKTVIETRARHILLQPDALRTDEQTKLQARELHDRLTGGGDFEELAREHSDDTASRSSGGDLGWQPPGVFAPEFEDTINALQPGDFSTPFRTAFGWHIATVVDRRTRDTTAAARRARARAAIQNRKVAEEYDMWLRRLRAEAYVEYRLESETRTSAS